MPTIELTAEQSLAISNAAAALCPADRDAFFAAVARQLAGHEIGDGSVARAISAAFQTYWHPPDFVITRAAPRWSRTHRPRFDHASKR